MIRPKIWTARGKRHFVRGLCRAVERDVLADVDAMPLEWDGWDLREYLAEAFGRERFPLSVGQRFQRARYRREAAALRAARALPPVEDGDA